MDYLVLKENCSQNKKPRISPSYSASNLKDYNWLFYVILGDSCDKPMDKPKFLGLRRIYKTYDYFWDRLNEKDEKELLYLITLKLKNF